MCKNERGLSERGFGRIYRIKGMRGKISIIRFQIPVRKLEVKKSKDENLNSKSEIYNPMSY